MTQSQITYFLTVAETLSFSKAAAALFVSQPAVSKQVSLLEEELGLTLFDRTRQGVFLTESGRLFSEMFQDFIDRFHDTMEEAHHVNRRLHDVVRIGCSEGFHLSEFYSDVQTFFDAKYPNIQLELSSDRADHLLPALKESKIDLMISLGAPPVNGPELVLRKLNLPKSTDSDRTESINVAWLSSNASGAKHLFVNELLFHFKQTMLPENQPEGACV